MFVLTLRSLVLTRVVSVRVRIGSARGVRVSVGRVLERCACQSTSVHERVCHACVSVFVSECVCHVSVHICVMNV